MPQESENQRCGYRNAFFQQCLFWIFEVIFAEKDRLRDNYNSIFLRALSKLSGKQRCFHLAMGKRKEKKRFKHSRIFLYRTQGWIPVKNMTAKFLQLRKIISGKNNRIKLSNCFLSHKMLHNCVCQQDTDIGIWEKEKTKNRKISSAHRKYFQGKEALYQINELDNICTGSIILA